MTGGVLTGFMMSKFDEKGKSCFMLAKFRGAVLLCIIRQRVLKFCMALYVTPKSSEPQNFVQKCTIDYKKIYEILNQNLKKIFSKTIPQNPPEGGQNWPPQGQNQPPPAENQANDK